MHRRDRLLSRRLQSDAQFRHLPPTNACVVQCQQTHALCVQGTTAPAMGYGTGSAALVGGMMQLAFHPLPVGRRVIDDEVARSNSTGSKSRRGELRSSSSPQFGQEVAERPDTPTPRRETKIPRVFEESSRTETEDLDVDLDQESGDRDCGHSRSDAVTGRTRQRTTDATRLQCQPPEVLSKGVDREAFTQSPGE